MHINEPTYRAATRCDRPTQQLFLIVFFLNNKRRVCWLNCNGFWFVSILKCDLRVTRYADALSVEQQTMGLRVRESFLQLTASSHCGRESLFMGYNETRDVGTLTINFISDCDNDVTLLYLPTATGRPSTPLIKPPPSRWMHKFLPRSPRNANFECAKIFRPKTLTVQTIIWANLRSLREIVPVVQEHAHTRVW